MPLDSRIEFLKPKSQWLRKELFELIVGTKRGHVPSSYSCAEAVLAICYGGYLKADAKAPRKRERDRILVSKGHAAAVLYPIFADLGFFPRTALADFAKPEGLLRMYADHSIPGIEAVTGSLGHGLGVACGFALAGKKDRMSYDTFVILGDGECYEGSVWENALFAAHSGLDNLVVVVDRNGMIILDETEKCVRLEPLADKWRAFGWNTHVVDGHRYSELLPALDEATKRKNGKPTVIVANTVKGKGISFMEGRSDWHNKMPNPEEAAIARKDLQTNCIHE